VDKALHAWGQSCSSKKCTLILKWSARPWFLELFGGFCEVLYMISSPTFYANAILQDGSPYHVYWWNEQRAVGNVMIVIESPKICARSSIWTFTLVFYCFGNLHWHSVYIKWLLNHDCLLFWKASSKNLVFLNNIFSYTIKFINVSFIWWS
jgi:hypothetical protein